MTAVIYNGLAFGSHKNATTDAKQHTSGADANWAYNNAKR